MKNTECITGIKSECCFIKLLCQWCMHMCTCTKNLFTLEKKKRINSKCSTSLQPSLIKKDKWRLFTTKTIPKNFGFWWFAYFVLCFIFYTYTLLLNHQYKYKSETPVFKISEKRHQAFSMTLSMYFPLEDS